MVSMSSISSGEISTAVSGLSDLNAQADNAVNVTIVERIKEVNLIPFMILTSPLEVIKNPSRHGADQALFAFLLLHLR